VVAERRLLGGEWCTVAMDESGISQLINHEQEKHEAWLERF